MSEEHVGQQFWRAHPDNRPFSKKDATSREWCSTDVPDRGYSAFAEPHRLVGYFNPGEREDYGGSHVVSFTGHVVGKGMDSEPLVMPDMKHVQHMDWSDFHRDVVGEDRVAEIERNNGWRDD